LARTHRSVGAGFVINGQPFTVVGITPPGFFGDRVQSTPPAFFIPLNDEPLDFANRHDLEEASLDWLDLIGRIRPGATPPPWKRRCRCSCGNFCLSPLSKVEERDKPLVAKQTLHFSHGGNGVQMMRDEYKDGLHLLMWVSGFVLLIACANLANLMLVRATNRQQQTSVRSALGAPRMTLVRQTLTESIVLAVLGGIAGIVVAFAGTRVILYLAFQKEYVPIRLRLRCRYLALLSLSLFDRILFGVGPAWLTSKANPVEALRGANRSTANMADGDRNRWWFMQAALSLVLLCAAGLLTRSLSNMQHQDFGFVTTNRYIAAYRPADGGLQAGPARSALSPTARQPGGDPGREAGELLHLQPDGRR
jgi:hypothetical protein